MIRFLSHTHMYQILPVLILALSFALGYVLHGLWSPHGETDALLTEEY